VILRVVVRIGIGLRIRSESGIGHNGSPSTSRAESVRAAGAGGALAARGGSRVFLAGLALGLIAKMLALLRIFIRLRRVGFRILFAFRVRLNVGHVVSP
jgi:hypothetical protein